MYKITAKSGGTFKIIVYDDGIKNPNELILNRAEKTKTNEKCRVMSKRTWQIQHSPSLREAACDHMA